MKFTTALISLTVAISAVSGAAVSEVGTGLVRSSLTSSLTPANHTSKEPLSSAPKLDAVTHTTGTDLVAGGENLKAAAANTGYPFYVCDGANGKGACSYWGIQYYKTYYTPPKGWDNRASYVNFVDKHTGCYFFINEPSRGKCSGSYVYATYRNTPANFVKSFNNNVSCLYCVKI